MEEPYSVREINEMMKDVNQRFDRVDKAQNETLEQVKITNGKVKKITVALVALAFFSLGLGLANPQLLSLFLAII